MEAKKLGGGEYKYMICKKCQKEKTKEEFKKYTFNYSYEKIVYSKICLECKVKIKNNKEYKKHNTGANEIKKHPELFCKRCNVRFNGILGVKMSKENNKICEDCYKKINN